MKTTVAAVMMTCVLAGCQQTPKDDFVSLAMDQLPANVTVDQWSAERTDSDKSSATLFRMRVHNQSVHDAAELYFNVTYYDCDVEPLIAAQMPNHVLPR